MKDVRFYFDYGSPKAKRKGGDAPNAIAVFYTEPWYEKQAHTKTQDLRYGCAAALTDTPNAPVCGTSASWAYLRDSCKRVSEAEAYRVHPRLKEYMKRA